MSIVAWIIVGVFAGWLACVVSKGSGYGVVGDIIIGVVGAILAGSLMSVLFGYSAVSGLNIFSIIVAFIGAVILIAIFHAISYPARA